MKIRTSFFVFAALISQIRFAHAGPLAELGRWGGKYSYQKIDGRSFWQVDALTEVLSDALSPREMSDFTGTQGPETPVKVSGAYVSATICEAHNCGNHQYTIIVDSVRERVWVCYVTDQLMDQGKVQWVTNGHRRARADQCDPEEDTDGNAPFSARLAMIPSSLR